MDIYVRSEPTEYVSIDEWHGGVGWLAHPNEVSRRASHAIECDDGVWILDPLDAPGVDDLIADLGDVAGVAVLSSWHARDAGIFAERYGVPVSVPHWMSRVEERVNAPVVRYTDSFGDAGVTVLRNRPFPSFEEAILYHESTGTLVVPDSLGTAPPFTIGDERLGVELFLRLFPPRNLLGPLEPERVLFGHGEGVFEDAATALDDALDGSRRRFPRAFAAHFPTTVRSVVGAVRSR